MSGLQRDGPTAPRPAAEVKQSKGNTCSETVVSLRSTVMNVFISGAYIFKILHSLAVGKQYLRYGCRRKVLSKMVHKSFCNKSNMKPRGDTRDCNQKPCPPPMYALLYMLITE